MATERVEQLALFDNETKPTNGFSDPAFAQSKQSPVHRWVPWIAGYSCDFVREAVTRYSPRQGTVVDPFSGVGTTLVETLLTGRNAIGFEINPYAAFACRVKTQAHHANPQTLHNEVDRLRFFWRIAQQGGREPISVPPRGFNTRSPFYSPAVLRKVLLYLDFVETIECPITTDLFRLAFASTMVRYSNYSYEPSLGRRVSAGKEEIEDYPVIEAIADKLVEIVDDIVWMKGQIGPEEISSRVLNQSFFDCQDYVEPGIADLLVTSPPYLNNYHYNRNTRPHLYWLGFVQKPSDLKPFENMNFG